MEKKAASRMTEEDGQSDARKNVGGEKQEQDRLFAIRDEEPKLPHRKFDDLLAVLDIAQRAKLWCAGLLWDKIRCLWSREAIVFGVSGVS